MTKLLELWIHFMLRHRLKTLGLMFSLTAAAAALGSQVEIRTALLDMIKKSSPRAKSTTRCERSLGRTRPC